MSFLKKPHASVLIIVIIIFVLCLGTILKIFFTKNIQVSESEIAEKKLTNLTDPKTGLIAMRSMQTEEVASPEVKQRYDNKFSNAKVGKNSEAVKPRNRNIAADFKINGQNFNAIFTSYAVRNRESGRVKGMPYGYDRIDQPMNRDQVGEMIEPKLWMFENPNSKQIFVMTGALVVIFNKTMSADQITSFEQNNMVNKTDVFQKINTIIFKIIPGENIFEVFKKITSDSSVKSAKIEMLGKGVSVK